MGIRAHQGRTKCSEQKQQNLLKHIEMLDFMICQIGNYTGLISILFRTSWFDKQELKKKKKISTTCDIYICQDSVKITCKAAVSQPYAGHEDLAD